MAAITEYIKELLNKKDLSLDHATQLLDMIFDGDVPEAQIAAFLTASAAKGFTAEELAGFAKSLRTHAVKVNVNCDNLIDTCGTGGGKVKTFNISTATALVAAGAGAHVAKHGNRGITSSFGSADVLTELGVKVDAAPKIIEKCIEQAHIGFMFAPMFHPAMKYVQPVRKGLGFRTIFNFLGPLANPALAPAQVLGVADPDLMQTIAEALKLLGTKYAMVVHSDGMDEISTLGPTKITELKNGQITNKQINPQDFRLAPADIDDLKVTNAQSSAKAIKDILNNKDTGPKKDIVLLNTAAAIIAAGLADDFKSGLTLAEKSIADGNAINCLNKLIKISNE